MNSGSLRAYLLRPRKPNMRNNCEESKIRARHRPLHAPMGAIASWILVTMLFLPIGTGYAQQASIPKASSQVSKQEILEMLKRAVLPQDQIGELVCEEKGNVSFRMTLEIEGEFRQAGASEQLIQTLGSCLPAPPPPLPPPPPPPARIVVTTSPQAQVYLDDAFRGLASPQGELVIENPARGEHRLRVHLDGKKESEQRIERRSRASLYSSHAT